MVFDASAIAKDHPDLVIAKRAVAQARGRATAMRLLPALRLAGLGHRARRPCADGGGAPAPSGDAPRRSTGWRSGRSSTTVGDWATRGRGCGRAAGPFQYRNDHYPDVDDTAAVVLRAASRRPRALSRSDRPRRRMGARHAEPERRLGLVRRRQHALLPEPHSVRRSRRAARPADRGCDRALPRHAGAARLRRGPSGDGARRSTI